MKSSLKGKAESARAEAGGEAPFWRLTQGEKQAALVALVLSLIARAQTFLPGYSVDDYGHLLAPQHFSFAFSLSQGRPLVAPMLEGLRLLGLHPAATMTLSTLSLVLALLFAGLVVCRLMGIGDRPVECAAVMSLLSLHPYQAEIFTFRTASILMAIPVTLAFASLLAPKRRPWQWAAAIAAMAAAVSVYQTVVHYAAVALVLTLWVQALHGGLRAGWGRIRSGVALLALGVAAYLAALKLLLLITGVALNARGALIGLEDVGSRGAQIRGLIERIFLRGEPVMPVAPKLLLLAMLALTWVSAARSGRSGAGTWRTRLACMAGGTAMGVACTLGVLMVLKEWYPAPRVLSQIGLFWGGVLALGLLHAGPKARTVLLCLGAIIVMSCAGSSITVASEQIRLNRRDMMQAAQILAEVDRLPDAEKLIGVWLHGGTPFYPAGFQTAYYDLNVSALSVTWARTWLLNEVSGRNYALPSEALVSQAARHCTGAPRWPRPGSVARIGDYAVVCLPEP